MPSRSAAQRRDSGDISGRYGSKFAGERSPSAIITIESATCSRVGVTFSHGQTSAFISFALSGMWRTSVRAVQTNRPNLSVESECAACELRLADPGKRDRINPVSLQTMT